MFQTSVSCTRNATFCIGDTEIALLCVQKYKGVILGVEKAPAGMWRQWHPIFKMKIAYFMSLRHKNGDSVFQKNRTSIFGEEKAPAGMSPPFLYLYNIDCMSLIHTKSMKIAYLCM